MSGHNKWSQIKVKKGAEDAKRSKLFSMLVRQITIEAKRSNGNREDPGLKGAISRAQEANMPKDNIERAIAKATGANAESFENVIYEAFGPGGVAIIIEGITDNKNRTTPEIKHLLSKQGLALGGQGSALWAFERVDGELKAKTTVSISDNDEQKLAEIVETLEDHEDIKNVITNVE
jgi:YebC/PmpR family DNA-binding regulatory protein